MNERLANEKISKLLLSLAIPSILAQMVTLLYNLVDRIYIGRMEDGALAIAGIGLCSAIITIITAFTNLFGRGGAPLASISLGADENDQANKIISNCFSSLVLSSIVIMIVLYIFGEEILLLFGASANTLSYAKDYLNIYLLGTIFVQLSVGMNYFINCQGYAKFGRSNFYFYFKYGSSGSGLGYDHFAICFLFMGNAFYFFETVNNKNKERILVL